MRPVPTCRLLSSRDYCGAFAGGIGADHDYLNTSALRDQQHGLAATLVWGPASGGVWAFATITVVDIAGLPMLHLARMPADDPAAAVAGAHDDFVTHVVAHGTRAAEHAGIQYLLANQTRNAFVEQLQSVHCFAPVEQTDYLWRAVATPPG